MKFVYQSTYRQQLKEHTHLLDNFRLEIFSNSPECVLNFKSQKAVCTLRKIQHLIKNKILSNYQRLQQTNLKQRSMLVILRSSRTVLTLEFVYQKHTIRFQPHWKNFNFLIIEFQRSEAQLDDKSRAIRAGRLVEQ